MLTQTKQLQPYSGRGAQVRPSVVSLPLANIFDLLGAPMPFVRNAVIYGESEPADYLYKVISGSVRTYRMFSDGHRHIDAFYFPGDVFGFETGANRGFSAEAIAEAKVLVVKRRTVTTYAASEHTFARELLDLITRELTRAQNHIMLLIKTAQERVAGFLLEMAERGRVLHQVELPMSRQDIADYLGLTIETVSRTLTQLENTATIALPTSRRVLLRNPAALRQLNS